MTGTKEVGVVRALVCEDEPLARRAIREYLSDVSWIEIVGEAPDGKEATRLLHKLEPDLVFLDVRMPGMSGLEVLDVATHRAAVVFTTAHDEYAVTAFELGAVDYLVKPFGRDRLLETLARVRVRLLGEGMTGEERSASGRSASGRGPRSSRLFARKRGAIVPVQVADVVRIDASSVGAELVTSGGTLDLDGTLGEIEARLDPSDFVRVHRSHIVNLTHVTSIRRYDDRRLEVRLSDGSTVVSSRKGSRALRDVMG